MVHHCASPTCKVTRRRPLTGLGASALGLIVAPHISLANVRVQMATSAPGASAFPNSLGLPELQVIVSDTGYAGLPATTPAGRYLLTLEVTASEVGVLGFLRLPDGMDLGAFNAGNAQGAPEWYFTTEQAGGTASSGGLHLGRVRGEYRPLVVAPVANRQRKRQCMITTPLCTLLGIEHPILNASMAGTATGRLAAAVSEAGGFGMIGGTNPEGASWLREQIRIARSLTARPFGVGFISAFPETADLTQVALEEGVAAINHSFADPTPFVTPTHAAGVKIFVQVQTLTQAVAAAQAGVDVIIAQGGEAGGHAGALGTFALLPAVVDAVAPIPVVAAGGIADGRGLAAALLLGAQGAWMGTRFVTSHEWGGPSWEQAAVLAATSDDTVQTRLYDLIAERPFPAENRDRMLRNAFIDRWTGRESEILAHREALLTEIAAGHERADLAVAGVSAGVSAGLISSARPAGEIVRDIAREAEVLLRERARLLVG